MRILNENNRFTAAVDTVDIDSVIKEGVTSGGRYFVVFAAVEDISQPAGAIITHPVKKGVPNPYGAKEWTPEDYDLHLAEHGGVLGASTSIWRGRGKTGSPGIFWSMGEFIPQDVLDSVKEMEKPEKVPKETWEETVKRLGTNTVRKNMLTRPGYTPYCGAEPCSAGMPRSTWDVNKQQFTCRCGWVSELDRELQLAVVKFRIEAQVCQTCGVVNRDNKSKYCPKGIGEKPSHKWELPVDSVL